MNVTKDKVVTIDYTLTNDDGQVIDTSRDREPLAYLHGAGNIVPGLESALEGKAEGEQVNVEVQPDQGYGQRDERLVQSVPRSSFSGVDNVERGMQFQARTQSGARIVTVVDVQDENVTVDANHPLAGETLNFDITVRGIREATSEELTHGHVHGAGGHAH
jgi:FKBP-type peptidyl-prolyl cis-trans isomerase SlyD